MPNEKTKTIEAADIDRILPKLETDVRDWLTSDDDDTPGQYFFGLVGESQDFLRFFGITSDYKKCTMDVPINCNYDNAILIVGYYLSIVDALSFDASDDKKRTVILNDNSNADIELIKLAIDYDTYTVDNRGADDGTFDYAGSFVITILETIIVFLKTERS